MPELVANRLVVSGDRWRIADFRDAVRGRDDNGAELALDFERVRPAPPELASGGRVRDTAVARELLDEFCCLKASGTDEERAAFLFGRGCGVMLLDPAIRRAFCLSDDESPQQSLPTWRRCAWGVKWNMTAERLNVSQAADGRSITFLLDTPSAPPLALVHALAARFPDLAFELAYATADGVAGYCRYEAGALVASEEEAEDEDGDPVALLRRLGWTEAADELDGWLAEVAADLAGESA
jgi:hypothetical protein